MPIDETALKVRSKKYFSGIGETAALDEAFINSEELEYTRDYWVIINKREELVGVSSHHKGTIDEFDLLQSYVDSLDADDYYCFKTTHKDFNRLRKMIIDNGATYPYVPVKEIKALTDRELKGHLCKKAGQDFLKCTKLNIPIKPLKSISVYAMQEQPSIVRIDQVNLVMFHSAVFDVGTRIDISFSGEFKKALPERKVALVKVAVDEREGEYIRRVLRTLEIAPDFIGEFEIFAKDRIERPDQLYQVILESKSEGGTGCGICNKTLLIDEENTATPRILKEGYFDR